MIKNKLFYLPLFTLAYAPSVLWAQDADSKFKDDIYEKVFGAKSLENRNLLLDVTLDDFLVGEINIVLRGDEILSLEGEDLTTILKDKIRVEKKNHYQFRKGQIAIQDLPFKVRYYPSELRLSLEINSQDLNPKSANVYDDLVPYFSKSAISPAFFSMGLNYKLEQSFSNQKEENSLKDKNQFFAQTDFFMNIGEVSFENKMNYFSNKDQGWTRQQTRAIYDRNQDMQRVEVGDVSFPIVGYQQSKLMGGVSFYKDFALNPYRNSKPMSSFEYRLESRSLVKTYVNNVLLKAEYMAAGNYSVKDIPLNNGLNNIKVEAVDEFGVSRVFLFNEAGFVDLLAEDVSRYSLALGAPSYYENGELKYNKDDNAFVTAFYQWGATRHWTPSFYGQGDGDYQILGTNHIRSTNWGNLLFDLAGSKNDEHKGSVAQLGYQFNMFGAYWYDSHTLTTKFEYRSPFFNEIGLKERNKFDYTGIANYSVPLFEHFNLSLGGSYAHPSIVDHAKITYDLSVTTRIVESSSLTFYFSRMRDEEKKWGNQLYFYFNMSFGKSSTFVSAFYDQENNTKRITAIRDTGRKYDDLKIAANLDDNKSDKNGSIDLQYNSVLADVGIRQEVQKRDGQKQSSHKTSLRALGSLAFVKNDNESAFSIGRPISNSFAIFKPNKEWKNQKVGVQTSNGIDEARSGLFGETLISGLTPYQYKRLMLNSSELEDGYVLDQESFVVFPRYNSGHLFVIGKNGLLTIKGKILNKNKKPIPLSVGLWVSEDQKYTPFFTDREGNFLIQGVEAKKGSLELSDKKYRRLKIDLSKKKQGIEDLGSLILKEQEAQ